MASRAPRSAAPFHRIGSEAELRPRTAALLAAWGRALLRGRLRCHLPRRAGLMRLLPGMPFHLRAELFLQVSGSTTFTFPGETIRVGPGELCLVPPGLPHSEEARPGRGLPFCNLVFMYQGGVGFHLALADGGAKPYVAVPSRIPGLGEGEGDRLAAQLDAVPGWGEGSEAWRLAVRGAFLAHLSSLRACLERPAPAPDAEAEPLKVAQVRRLVMQHLSRADLSVASIARMLQSSPDYLSRLFRSATGASLVSYLEAQRMVRAQGLLEKSDLNVAEVGRACGYDDPGYFARRFRRSQGVTPRAFRRTALRRI
ncbi:MAG TPA: helix-turn-helix domain-containing protein [Candidatus Methylacidiphilales bacterium]